MTTYLTTAQAAEILSLSPGTLANWRVYGEGPRWVRLGSRSVRYLLQDIDSWAQQNLVEV